MGIAQTEYAESTTPRIVGTMPRDGAEGIIRTAFVAVGLDVGEEGIGLDIETVTEENIKLYPKDHPDSPIKSFLTSSQIPLNITIEPIHALAPNTTYIFEITDSLKDLSGRSFAPYKISFTTSEVSLRKYISMKRPKPKRIKGFRPKNDPDILPSGPKLYAEPVAESLIAQAEPQKANAETSPEPETAAERKAREKQEREDQIQAMLAAQRAKIETKSSAKNPVATADSIQEAATPTFPSSVNPLVAASPPPAAPSPPPSPKTESIDFPKARIQSGGKLPVSFVMMGKREVKYMIKNAKGKIVKRGTAALNPGPSGKGIDVSTMVPGRYRISIKIEEKIVHHTFVILE